MCNYTYNLCHKFRDGIIIIGIQNKGTGNKSYISIGYDEMIRQHV